MLLNDPEVAEVTVFKSLHSSANSKNYEQGCSLFQIPYFSMWGPHTAASTLQRRLLEMQSLGTHLSSPGSEAVEV